MGACSVGHSSAEAMAEIVKERANDTWARQSGATSSTIVDAGMDPDLSKRDVVAVDEAAQKKDSSFVGAPAGRGMHYHTAFLGEV